MPEVGRETREAESGESERKSEESERKSGGEIMRGERGRDRGERVWRETHRLLYTETERKERDTRFLLLSWTV